LAIHGYNHVDYTKMSEQEQKRTLDLANNKTQTLFGTKSNIFIPPYGRFNNSTLVAMSDLKIGILSATIGSVNDDRFIWNPSVSSEPHSILQFPETTGFMIYANNIWQNVSNSAILDSINNGIAQRGYAVVVLHPQNFVKTENGQSVDVIDSGQLSNLSNLIDSVLAQKIKITTFENIVGSTPLPTQVQQIANTINNRNTILEEKRAQIQDMINECNLEIKNTSQNHKQVAHECKATIKKSREEYKDIREQLKSEFKQVDIHIKKFKHKHNKVL
jgi:Polysaccharide deacetylase